MSNRSHRCRMAIYTAIMLSIPTTADAQSTPFTYQGLLKDGGSPANGDFDMVFTLWNDPVLSAPANQVGPTLSFDGAGGNPPPVTITNGLFTVLLDFGAAYNGDKRWLEIGVSGTTLSPRQELTAAPYAHGLSLPFTGNADVDNGSRTALWVTNTGAAATDFDFGLRGSASGVRGVGVLGEATATASGEGFGVLGQTAGDLFAGGVVGYATSPTGQTFGVSGQADSVSGIGVSGVSNYIGSRGLALASSGAAYGVLGTSSSNEGYGVYGLADAVSGFTAGGYFESSSPNGRGVVGSAFDLTGTNIGVYGETFSPDGYAGYFNGRCVLGGDVGIGIVNPTAALDVDGTAKVTGLQLTTGAAAGRVLTSDATGIGTWQATVFYAAGAGLQLAGNVFSITSNGVTSAMLASDTASLNKVSGGAMSTNGSLVGIGSASPAGQLDVRSASDSNGRIIVANNSANTWLQLVSGAGNGATDPALIWSDNAVGDDLRLGIGSIDAASFTERLRITGAGRVGIGTTAPTAKVHVGFVGRDGIVIDGDGTDDAFLSIDNNQSGSLHYLFDDTSAGHALTLESGIGHDLVFNTNGNAARMRITAGGDVGIGTAAPSQRLHVVGSICATGAIVNCSDARFKESVETLPDALDKLSRLRGVRFDWRREEFPDHQFSEDRQIGLIAQEVREVAPEVVQEGTDGYLSVDYGRLAPILIEAVKQLRREKDAQLAELRAENARLRAGLDELTRTVSELRDNVVKEEATR